jgi:phosphatidylserine decarboxylase
MVTIMSVVGAIMVLVFALIVGSTLFYFLIFRRDPNRIIPASGIVAPTDGKVVAILHTSKSILTVPKGQRGRIRAVCADVATNCTLISIMMTPLNVHYQRAPISGKVVYTRHVKGKFKNAVFNQDWGMLENEHNEILIKNGNLKIKVIQIAGVLARRIRCYVKQNVSVEKGQKIGFIDLGSQVTVIMPNTIKLRVNIGDKVKGGETIIGDPQ